MKIAFFPLLVLALATVSEAGPIYGNVNLQTVVDSNTPQFSRQDVLNRSFGETQSARETFLLELYYDSPISERFQVRGYFTNQTDYHFNPNFSNYEFVRNSGYLDLYINPLTRARVGARTFGSFNFQNRQKDFAGTGRFSFEPHSWTSGIGAFVEIDTLRDEVLRLSALYGTQYYYSDLAALQENFLGSGANFLLEAKYERKNHDSYWDPWFVGSIFFNNAYGFANVTQNYSLQLGNTFHWTQKWATYAELGYKTMDYPFVDPDRRFDTQFSGKGNVQYYFTPTVRGKGELGFLSADSTLYWASFNRVLTKFELSVFF